MSSAETKPLLGASSDAPGPNPIYRETKNTTSFILVIGGFLMFVGINLVLSILMASIQAWKVNKLYVLLLVSLLAFAQVPFFMVFFIYKEYVSAKHMYAVFVTGIAVVIECIATDILVFTVDTK